MSDQYVVRPSSSLLELAGRNVDFASEIAQDSANLNTSAARLLLTNTIIVVRELSPKHISDLPDEASMQLTIAAAQACDIAPIPIIDAERLENEDLSNWYYRTSYIQPFRSLHDDLAQLTMRDKSTEQLQKYGGAVLASALATKAVLNVYGTLPAFSYNKNYFKDNTTAAAGRLKAAR